MNNNIHARMIQFQNTVDTDRGQIIEAGEIELQGAGGNRGIAGVGVVSSELPSAGVGLDEIDLGSDRRVVGVGDHSGDDVVGAGAVKLEALGHAVGGYGNRAIDGEIGVAGEGDGVKIVAAVHFQLGKGDRRRAADIAALVDGHGDAAQIKDAKGMANGSACGRAIGDNRSAIESHRLRCHRR